MEFLAWLIHQIFGKKKFADSTPPEYVSTDGKEKVFDNYEDLENYEKEAALKNAKYVYIGDPNYGVLTWSGKGRRPRWVDDYLANGGDLSEIEYPPKKMTNSDNFIIKINQDLSLSKGPHGSFAHHKFKDVKGDLWFDPDRTLYDFDGVAIVPMEVIDELKRQGFNMSYAEDDHIDTHE